MSVSLSEEDFYARFPSEFKWGSASSCETSSDWKRRCSLESNGSMDSNASSTVSHNSFYEEISLLKDMNATCYKFSLCWSRMFPGTHSHPNKSAVQYYDNLINTLISYNIEPIVVLVQDNQNSRDWTQEQTVKAFGSYARFCFKKFGDRVKHWIPINDPSSWRQSETRQFKVFRNLVKGQNLVNRIYQKEFKQEQSGNIGLSLNSNCILNNRCNDEVAVPDFAACSIKQISFNPNATMDFSSFAWEQLKKKGESDFIELICDDIPYQTELRNSGRRNSFSNLNNIRWILNKVKTEFNNIPILLSGKKSHHLAESAMIMNLNDLKTTTHFRAYATEILKAIVLDECNVTGFLPGVLIDSLDCELDYEPFEDDHSLKMRIERVSVKYLSKLFKIHHNHHESSLSSL